MGATALTSWLRQRIDAAERGHERRGAQPPPGVGRRGGPGPHHPPQQGRRVPDRLLPVPVGARLDPQRAPSRSSSTTPTPTTSAYIDVGMDGPDFPAPPAPARGRAARRGPAARLRRADPRPAPGRRVVGRLLGQPQLGARPAAVRARRRGQRRRRRAASTPTDAAADGALRGARRRGARLHQRRAATLGLPDRLGGPAASSRPSSPRPASTATSTGAGGAPPTATSPPGRTRRAVASEPEERGRRRRASRSQAPVAAAPDEAQPSLLLGVPSLLAAMPVGVHVGTFVHRVFEATDFAAPDLDAELATHVAAALARRRVDVGDPQRWWPACARRSRRRSGRCSAAARCATSSAPTASTSSIFELPLVGGDEPTGRLTLAAIARRPARAPRRRRPARRLRRSPRRPDRCARACAAT